MGTTPMGAVEAEFPAIPHSNNFWRWIGGVESIPTHDGPLPVTDTGLSATRLGSIWCNSQQRSRNHAQGWSEPADSVPLQHDPRPAHRLWKRLCRVPADTPGSGRSSLVFPRVIIVMVDVQRRIIVCLRLIWMVTPVWASRCGDDIARSRRTGGGCNRALREASRPGMRRRYAGGGIGTGLNDTFRAGSDL